MIKKISQEKQRQRAPSKSSLETRQKILDAAEHLFAFRSYDAASIRDIAQRADVKLGLVNHHFGSKEDLFFKTVERRAEELARLRLDALDLLKASGETITLRGVLEAFFYPYLDKAENSGPGWLAYARLVAMVSAEERWSTISRACFDPTAKVFLTEIAKLYPETDLRKVSATFVFSISSQIALCTSAWRVDAMAGKDHTSGIAELKTLLVDFATAGIHSALSQQAPNISANA
ncbi:transcriptional regulator, TetR family [Pseudovibrio denitrificans]|uniref:Transcriptional regulator, TetR family n=1 Tax=Pseudovibrio denitrificans TaxID=258256 RepID=A0A1I7BLR9_9HYPH|nr:TetR/AcrR family transcriptional regulator [Pseudovibrio denitrificans]SFT88096.1 transcriptional regulator, TetR family [Pseudovibrio denitrificans]